MQSIQSAVTVQATKSKRRRINKKECNFGGKMKSSLIILWTLCLSIEGGANLIEKFEFLPVCILIRSVVVWNPMCTAGMCKRQ